MNNEDHSRSIFDFVIESIAILESKFSALNTFTLHESHRGLCYDKKVHSFVPNPESKTHNHPLELRSALADIADHMHRILPQMHRLSGELTHAELTKVNQELLRLVNMSSHALIHVAAYTQKTEIPTEIRSDLIHLAQMIKGSTNREEFKTGSSTSIPLRRPPPSQLRPIDPQSSEAIFQAITDDVDQILQRLPFTTTATERDRIIKERYEEHLKKPSPKLPGGMNIANKQPVDLQDEWD